MQPDTSKNSDALKRNEISPKTSGVLADLEAGETAIPLGEIRDQAFCPKRHGKRLDKSVAFRWASRGVRGIVLETSSAGGLKISTRSAVLRFFARLNGDKTPLPITTSSTSAKRAARAERDLAEMGMR